MSWIYLLMRVVLARSVFGDVLVFTRQTSSKPHGRIPTHEVHTIIRIRLEATPQHPDLENDIMFEFWISVKTWENEMEARYGGGSINACHITNKYALMQVLITWIAKDVRWTNSAWCQQNSGVSKICVPPARQMFQARNSKQDLENPTAPRRVRDPSGDPWLF